MESGLILRYLNYLQLIGEGDQLPRGTHHTSQSAIQGPHPALFQHHNIPAGGRHRSGP
jgi:hypothetical protein